MFYRLQNEAVLSDRHQSYQQRHRAMNCVTPNLQKSLFREDFPLRILKLFGLMGWDDEVGFSRKWMAVNTALKLKNAAHIFFFFLFAPVESQTV